MPLTPTRAPTLVTFCKVVPVVGAELKSKLRLSWGTVKPPNMLGSNFCLVTVAQDIFNLLCCCPVLDMLHD